MAWVNRTTRDQGPGNFRSSSSAAAHLGPGSYASSTTRRVKPNAVPFGCSSRCERDGAEATSPETFGRAFVTPGPGAYASNNALTWEASPEQRTSVFQSKTERDMGIHTSNINTPGPGAYSKEDTIGRKKKKKAVFALQHLSETDRSNAANKIKWARIPTAPSIPVPAQSFGYEQGPYGKLVRHEPIPVGHSGKGDDTSGPGEYDPMRNIKSIEKPRAADFSKGKVSRLIEETIRTKEGIPGPGQYDGLSKETFAKDSFRASAVFKSSLSREQLMRDELKRETPGPGAYAACSAGFGSNPKPEHLQFFGSTATRFEGGEREEAIPGPGSYYAPPVMTRTQYSNCRKQKNIGFSSKRSRFESCKPKQESLAAPGSYNTVSAFSSSLGKVTSRVRSFGSTTKRFDATSTPPSQLQSTESRLEQESNLDHLEDAAAKQTHTKTQPLRSSAFASATTRFQPAVTSIAPSPGEYAGPGYYSTPTAITQKPLHMARPEVLINAGPGQYNAASIEQDWNRPTYNITIASEMEYAASSH